MNHHLDVDLELLSDVAITAKNSTVGGHETLDYIPGACLLGAVAKDIYSPLSASGEHLGAFFGGAVSFGNATRVTQGGQCWPVPLSLHTPKKQPAFDEEGYFKDVVLNLARQSRNPDQQYKQLRGYSVTEQGQKIAHNHRSSMRTAIDSEGRARDGFLFVVSSMPQGLVLRARISATSSGLLAKIDKCLLDKTIKVGRSRTAEFGSVRVRKAQQSWTPPTLSATPWETGVLLWCLTDLCLRDPVTDQPTLAPSAEHFGLTGLTFDPSKSFLRTRKYSPFNGTRKRPDLERQVIVAGSVLSFHGRKISPQELQTLQAKCLQGIGEYTHEGLGLVAAEPVLLFGGRPPVRPSELQATPEEPSTLNNSLVSWLQARTEEKKASWEAWELTRLWMAEVSKHSVWQNISSSQWGELRGIARLASYDEGRTLKALLDKHFGRNNPKEPDIQQGTRMETKRWGAKYGGQTLADHLVGWISRVLETKDGRVAALALELLANQATRHKRQLPVDDRIQTGEHQP